MVEISWGEPVFSENCFLFIFCVVFIKAYLFFVRIMFEGEVLSCNNVHLSDRGLLFGEAPLSWVGDCLEI
jgi:hypothetical protein